MQCTMLRSGLLRHRMHVRCMSCPAPISEVGFSTTRQMVVAVCILCEGDMKGGGLKIV